MVLHSQPHQIVYWWLSHHFSRFEHFPIKIQKSHNVSRCRSRPLRRQRASAWGFKSPSLLIPPPLASLPAKTRSRSRGRNKRNYFNLINLKAPSYNLTAAKIDPTSSKIFPGRPPHKMHNSSIRGLLSLILSHKTMGNLVFITLLLPINVKLILLIPLNELKEDPILDRYFHCLNIQLRYSIIWVNDFMQ